MVAQNTVRTCGVIQDFDLWKAFGYIDIVVKTDFFWETTYLTSYVHNMLWATILYMPLTHGAVSNSFPLKDLYRQVSQKS